MQPMEITEGNFAKEVLESPVPVLVDFYASWCGPCMVMSPIVDLLAENADGYKVGKINVDEQPTLATANRIMSIPTLVVFKGGKPSGRLVGVQSEQDILALIKKNM